MKTSNLLKSTIIAAMLFASCGRSENAASEDKASAEMIKISDLESAPAPPPSSMTGGAVTETKNVSVNKEISDEREKTGKADHSQQSSTMMPAEKIAEKIKKTADINLTVDDYKKTRAAIESIIKSGKGYIGSENEQNNTYNISNNMVIRVANKDFDQMVSSISALEAHVNSKNIYIEDVTAQFVDITARLKSKKEVELRYRDLLQKAARVTDILEIEEQLRVIREEIEAKEGELKYLNDQVAYSTINLGFHQDFEFNPTESPGFFGRMGNAFGNGWNGFLTFIVGLVYAWPLWLILAAGGYFLYRFIRKRVKK